MINNRTEYAIRALLYLAKQPRGEIVLKKDICQTQDITPAFLTKILQPLIKLGIVGSQRGVGGGGAIDLVMHLGDMDAPAAGKIIATACTIWS